MSILEVVQMMRDRKVTIVKCACNQEGCNYYGLSDGVFYQGNGWEKERAQEYADAINAYDAQKLRDAEAQMQSDEHSL